MGSRSKAINIGAPGSFSDGSEVHPEAKDYIFPINLKVVLKGFVTLFGLHTNVWKKVDN